MTTTLSHTILTASSTAPSPRAVASELRAQLAGQQTTFLVVFASSRHDPAELSAYLAEAFPGVAVFGCTTAGELISGRMLKQSVVAMGFDAETIPEVHLEVFEHLADGHRGVDAGLERLATRMGVKIDALDHERWLGLLAVDGLSGAEERVMDRLGDRTHVTVVGGSAGDDLAFKRTHVFAHGRAYRDAAVLALVRPARGFALLKTQSFEPLERSLTVTRADEATRTVYEFDGKPAVQAYAEAVGLPPEVVHEAFMRHPLGLIVNGEIFVRSPQQARDGAMVFYCQVLEGMTLRVLTSGDIVKDTRRDLNDRLAAVGPVRAAINFHCILRTLELEQKGQADAYGRLFASLPTVGFSTYGELYIGHINQTSTIALIK